MFETDQHMFEALCAAFPGEIISWRVGPTNKKFWKEGDKRRGQPLCYIDARDVMDRFDTVCGFGGWQNKHEIGLNGLIICNIGIKLPDGSWVWKADGAGATDMEAEKGAISDSFKRAAVRFGVGRYLYDIKTQWIELDEHWKISKEELGKLEHYYDQCARMVGWGERQENVAFKVLGRVVEQYVTQPGDVIEFREHNKGMIPLLPVKMRTHLNTMLDRVGTNQKEPA